jgi:hypothetical protein
METTTRVFQTAQKAESVQVKKELLDNKIAKV